jgi:phage terminase large subunit-like protein
MRSPKKERVWEPVKLMPWQKDFIEAMNAKEYSEVILSMGRGGGKSTFLAALSIFDLFESDEQGGPSVPIVAVSLQQAKDSIYSQVVFAVESEPELETRTMVYRGIGTERIEFPRIQGALFPKSADPKTLQGLNPWPCGYVDEIGHIETASWNAMKLGRKRPGAKIVGAGTWGPDTDSPLYEMRKQVEERTAPPTLLWRMYSGQKGASVLDEANWNRANPSLEYGLPALEFMHADAIGTPEAAFRTFRLNEPDVTGHDSWLGPDAHTVWNDLEDHYELDTMAGVYVGVDVGLVRDSTGIICVQQRPDGRLHAVAKIWMSAFGSSVDIAAVTQYLRDLAKRFNVIAISYDKRLFELPAIYLEEGGLPMVEVPQSVEQMTPIVGALFELIKRGGITHERDELFAAHVVNAVPRLNERGFTLSKSKSAPRGHIDACVALALAVDRYDHKPKAKSRAWVG